MLPQGAGDRQLQLQRRQLWFDTPTASDFSRGSGLYTADGKLKDWGRAFARLAPRITADRAVRTTATRTLPLPWAELVTEPDAVKSFRAQYLELFRRGKVVDFAIEELPLVL